MKISPRERAHRTEKIESKNIKIYPAISKILSCDTLFECIFDATETYSFLANLFTGDLLYLSRNNFIPSTA